MNSKKTSGSNPQQPAESMKKSEGTQQEHPIELPSAWRVYRFSPSDNLEQILDTLCFKRSFALQRSLVMEKVRTSFPRGHYVAIETPYEVVTMPLPGGDRVFQIEFEDVLSGAVIVTADSKSSSIRVGLAKMNKHLEGNGIEERGAIQYARACIMLWGQKKQEIQPTTKTKLYGGRMTKPNRQALENWLNHPNISPEEAVEKVLKEIIARGLIDEGEIEKKRQALLKRLRANIEYPATDRKAAISARLANGSLKKRPYNSRKPKSERKSQSDK